MANSGNFVPEHYRGKPDACMAVVMQAARWGMDPFAVAQRLSSLVISGVLGYEAQLVNAVINTMAPTKDRIHFEMVWGMGKHRWTLRGEDKQPEQKYIAPGWNLKMKLAWAFAPGNLKENQNLASLC